MGERLGQIVRQRRQELHLDQQELGQRAGMSQSAVSEIETGAITRPTEQCLSDLATALKVTYVKLLHAAVEDQDERNREKSSNP